MTIEEQDRIAEREKLAGTLAHISKELKRYSSMVDEKKEKISDIREFFWHDITVNVENDDDLMETYASIVQQTSVLHDQVRMQQRALAQIAKLRRLKQKPYFGRIDFKEAGGAEETVYVGIMTLMDEELGDIFVYDWRSPIAGMFYDYPPGPAQYETMDGVVGGQLLLKRQYVIRQGKLELMFDTGINIGDEMLQQLLGESRDDKMRSIVTTIQREQNRIIRDDKHKLLIVQGVAGSGKTSVALQRVAYLLYKYRDKMNEENMVLFSPNRMFNDYVSNVLPELGENNMQQTTYQDYLEHRLGGDFQTEDSYDQLEALLTIEDEAQLRIRTAAIAYKGSESFVRLLRAYAEYLKREGVMLSDIILRGRVLISREALYEQCYNQLGTAPLGARMEKLREWVGGELKAFQKESVKRVYRKLLREPKYIGAEEQLKQLSKKIVSKRFAPLYDSAKRIGFVDVCGTYRRLFEDAKLAAALAEASGTKLPDAWEAIAAETLRRLDEAVVQESALLQQEEGVQQHGRGLLPFEDATPLLMLKEAIQGKHTYLRIRQVIIDEGQDYSPFQMAYLRQMFPTARMTLLGDLNQGIYAHQLGQGYEELKQLFGESEIGMIRLTKSYRSTREIVEFSRAVLPDGEAVEPFTRSGIPPRLIQAADEALLAEQVAAAARAAREKGYLSIAVICKTEAESKAAYERIRSILGDDLPLQRVTKHSLTFARGAVVLPVYLAKGLEFDAVLVYNASEANYAREGERKLFYTACTRAQHELELFYTGALTPFADASLAR
ncbi:RNA polymerase recycling motor HelD [Paenibacillus sp. y28]|uniref:RNA polymerase recycling motor HelD n=1 Tax=Paenibacillus sp. y28 TaxID=3129110 RepID=UPI0030192C6B